MAAISDKLLFGWLLYWHPNTVLLVIKSPNRRFGDLLFFLSFCVLKLSGRNFEDGQSDLNKTLHKDISAPAVVHLSFKFSKWLPFQKGRHFGQIANWVTFVLASQYSITCYYFIFSFLVSFFLSPELVQTKSRRWSVRSWWNFTQR